MSKKILIFVLLCMCVYHTHAQSVTVTGNVTDAVDGMPLPGVNIIVKDTNNGVSTDFDGNFKISTFKGAILEFSYVGYVTKEVTVSSSSVINISLKAVSQGLDEVVVTALGIKRKTKTLTYASQNVKASDLTKTRDINIMNSLSGRSAGIDIKKSSSGSGGSTKIVLRGNKSISGDSQPLFVIDGVPMANNRGAQADMWGGADEGDGLSQLNPDDIESINILRGANAAILYGSQGANGVVVITTKKGKEGKVNISLNSGVSFETVIEIPQLQFKYGAQEGAKESWSTTANAKYTKADVESFFDTGFSTINGVSISGGNAKTTALFSYTNTYSKGVIANNNYQKHNVSLRQSTKIFGDKVKISSNLMLTQEHTKNRNAAGYYLNPLTAMYFFPRERDFSQYKTYEKFDNFRNMNLQNWFVNDHHQSNPFWIINKQPKDDITKRVITNLALEWSIMENLKLQVRGNYDYANKSFEHKLYAGSNVTNSHANGRWSYKKYEDTLLYTDALLTYNEQFKDFSLSAVLGASYQRADYGVGISVDTGDSKGLLYANEFHFSNISTNVQVNSIYGSRYAQTGFFINTQLGYKEMLFLDVSARQDQSSTLAGTGNDSYFYPAFGLTVLVNQMLDLPEFISFAKFRTSYTNVAMPVPFNKVSPQHSIDSGGGIRRNTTKPFTNLKPEVITSFEVGADWRFFNNRFGFDITYYHINSKDQFIELPAPSGSGYTNYYVNAGSIINKGIELSVNMTPIKHENITWKTSFNYAKNENKVEELHPDLTNPISTGSSEGYDSKFVKGGSIGDIYVHKFKRDDQGRIILDNKNSPTKTQQTELVGNTNPDWSLGWSNTLNYKQFSLNLLFNAKFGGKVVSQTEAMLDGYGVSKRSADARDAGGFTINAVNPAGTAVSKIPAQNYYQAIGGRNGIKEPYVYDRTNIRLSQLSLSYRLDAKKMRLSFLDNITFSLVGNNLFFIYKEAPFDPELAMNTGRNFQSLDNFNLPSTRTYGFNLQLNF